MGSEMCIRDSYSVGGDAAVDGEIGGLLDGDAYFVNVLSPTIIQLARSVEEANNTAPKFDATAIGSDLLANELDLGYAHGFLNGDTVIYENGGDQSIGGLLSGQRYFIKVVDATTVQLAAEVTGVAINFDALVATGTQHNLRLAVTDNDASGPNHNFGRVFDPSASVIDSFESIDLGYEHGFKNGQAVVYLAGGGEPIGGLQDGKVYYVVTVADKPTSIQLAAAVTDALLPDPDVINLTSPVVDSTKHGFAVAFDPNFIEPEVEADDGTSTTTDSIIDNLLQTGLDEAGLSSGETTEIAAPEPTLFIAEKPAVYEDFGIIDLGYKHNLRSGDAVVYNNGLGTDIGGLFSGLTYYVIELDSSYDTIADEDAGGIGNPELDLKDTGLRLSLTANGAAIASYLSLIHI